MQNSHKRWIILIAVALFIKIFSLFPNAVEHYYSRGVYPYIASFLRLLFGWVPFSVGDVLYFIIGTIIAVKLVAFIIKLFRRQVTKQIWLQKLKGVAAFILIVYILFNTLWGLNYNRLPMVQQLRLSQQEYTNQELTGLVQLLSDSLNAMASFTRNERMYDKQSIFKNTAAAYITINKSPLFLSYPHTSIKPSLYGALFNYIGVTGYYNPFTGEAQVNTTIPGFLRPSVTCHEVGHQVGYAKENEANFAGFLAACSYKDTAFRYAAFFEMYAYASWELHIRDDSAASVISSMLDPHLKADFSYLINFCKSYKNPIEPYITGIYAQYLMVNQQPKGIKTYSEVVAILIAWYKKQGVLL